MMTTIQSILFTGHSHLEVGALPACRISKFCIVEFQLYTVQYMCVYMYIDNGKLRVNNVNAAIIFQKNPEE